MRQLPMIIMGVLLGPLAGTALAADADGDGVDDRYDLCSGTPPGAVAWRSGEWAGCAGGQTRDSERPVSPTGASADRTAIMDAIDSCEDSLSARLSAHEIYAGSTCEPYYYQIEGAARPYLDFGRADLGTPAASMTTAHLGDRLRLCLTTDRGIASAFDDMDSSGCSPYAPADGWSYETPRVPEPTTTSAPSGGFYRPGVTYTTSGNVTFGSDGRTYTTSGNVTFGSDGTSYIHSGNVTFGSNGTTYITSGNVTFGSDGSSCISSGSTTFCH